MLGFLAVLLYHPSFLIVKITLLRLPFITTALIIAINNSTAAIFHLTISPLLPGCQQILPLSLSLISTLPLHPWSLLPSCEWHSLQRVQGRRQNGSILSHHSGGLTSPSESVSLRGAAFYFHNRLSPKTLGRLIAQTYPLPPHAWRRETGIKETTWIMSKYFRRLM